MNRRKLIYLLKYLALATTIGSQIVFLYFLILTIDKPVLIHFDILVPFEIVACCIAIGYALLLFYEHVGSRKV